jgi:acyl-CoA synthetase (NDP forming)
LASTDLAASGRRLRDVPLDRFFHPRVVAMIGASATKGSATRLLWRTVKKKVEAEGGTVHPVNPRYDEMDGVKCYPSILDVPGDIDLAVIASGDPVTMLEQVVTRRPTFVMIFAAGFAEAGGEGERKQERIRQLVADYGVFLLGPNTTLNSFLPFRDDLPGKRLALISHSGHQGRHLWQGQELGIPMSHWAPTGNEVDLEFADFVKYFAEQPEIGAIAGYIEGFKDGATVLLAADHAMRRGVPIVLVKVGRTAHGESTSMSHTAHLAGTDAVASAVFSQYGITRVDSMDELLHTSALLARAQPPRAEGVCIYSISGGTLAHLTDLVAAAGLSVPQLTQETQAALREWIPGYLRVDNPVDSGGGPSADWRGRKILETLVADPNIGVVVVPFVANAYHLSDAIARDVIDVAATSDKPICVIWGSPTGTEPVYQDVLVRSQVPVFRTFQQCLTALKGYFGYHAARRRYVSPFDAAARQPAPVATVPGRAGALSEAESKALLAAYGVTVSRDLVATSPAEAGAAAGEIGYPVVLKVLSADIGHKSDLGLVRIGLSSPEEVSSAFGQLVARAAALAPSAVVDGVLVSELVSGVETVVGLTHDEVFGPAVMFGLGGVFVEVLRDVSFRVPPFGPAEARSMIEEVKGYRVLRGVRGAPAADLDAVVAAIMGMQRLALDLGDRVREVDVNPLVARADSAVAVDALVTLW